jgi:hypothetical protein
MKKVIFLLLLFGLTALPQSALADEYVGVIPSGSTNATSSFLLPSGLTQAYLDISGYTKVLIGATCTASCPAVVVVTVGIATTATDAAAGIFQTSCTMTNIPAAPAQPQCLGPGAGYMNVTTTGWVSGTYSISVRATK